MMLLYDVIMRAIIDIPGELLTEIDSLAKREKISRAEAVRRAMAEYVAKRSTTRSEAAFGLWKLRRIDALEYEDSLRWEWHR